MNIYRRIVNFSLIFILLSFPASFVHSKTVPSSFADLAEKLMPSVVNIASTQTIQTTSNPFKNFQFPPGSPFEDMFKEFNRPTERKATALGSGFIIDQKGIVVTNNHVIQGAEDIIVSVNGSTEYKAKVIGTDPYMDLAVLEIQSDEEFETVSFGDSDKARVGDWVIAIGNPFGFGGTVTSGIISSRNRDIGLTRYDDFIQTDASINQGNSGGPLFDLDGKVVGINTAIIGRSGTLGYEAAQQMKNLNIGVSTSVGIGGDPINGCSFRDILEKFEQDDQTKAILMIGEIGGPQEAAAGKFAKENMSKPVVAYIAGLTAPIGRVMGHAGAIVSAYGESAVEKVELLKECGVTISKNPSVMGETVKSVLNGKKN